MHIIHTDKHAMKHHSHTLSTGYPPFFVDNGTVVPELFLWYIVNVGNAPRIHKAVIIHRR